MVISAVRLLHGNFYLIFFLGIVPNLIMYTLLCYYAMKRLSSGKMILAVIALFPTNVFMAASYSYDYWVNGFVFLGIAYFVGMCQEKDKIVSTKDTIIMCSSLALACVPKQIYVGLLLLPFFMPRKKIDNKKTNKKN